MLGIYSTVRRSVGPLFAICATLALTTGRAWSQDPAPLPELDQNWDLNTRKAWYTASQGSRLIPESWLRALDEPGGKRPFLHPGHIASFGYIPRGGTATGQPLPVGFAVDGSDDSLLERTKLRWKSGQGSKEPWIGLNCAACHTNEMTFKGRPIRVDGASNLADFQKFMLALNTALEETQTNPERWKTFQSRILPGASSATVDKDLKAAFDKLLAWQKLEADANKRAVEYGPGRVDAFGHIYNKVALILSPDAKGNAPDAPVSIPHIWRAPQYDRVQYNGIAKKIVVGGEDLLNYDIGALARNVGEVIGVFGDVRAVKSPGVTNGFISSVDVPNLSKLEDTLAKLRPPRWPSALFDEKPTDARKKKIAEGRVLFEKNCANCHQILGRGTVTHTITTQLSRFDGRGRHTDTNEPLEPPGTDPWMACNSFDYRSSTGILKDLDSTFIPVGKLGTEHHLAGLLQATVISTLYAKKSDLVLDALARLIGADRTPKTSLESLAPLPDIKAPPGADRTPEKQERIQRCFDPKANNPLLGYTSRPLNGIWASPPYLHNGSVPTMYDLLQPPSKRPTVFYVGTREYNPEKLGYVTREDASIGNTFKFEAATAAGVPIDGNSHAGHDYNNAKFNDLERYAIIEYLKTL